MNRTLLNSSKYKTFTQERDQALEQINLNTQLDVSRMLFEVLDHITGFVSHMAIQNQMSIAALNYLSNQLHHYVHQQFSNLLPLIVARLKRSRKAAYILTYFSELEAVARATQKTKPISRHEYKTQLQAQIDRDTITGQKLDKTVWHALSKLQVDIESAFKRALVQELTPLEVVQAIKKAYPPIVQYKRPPRTLKPLREADKPKDKIDEEEPEEDQIEEDQLGNREFDFYHDLTTDADWDVAVDAYQNTELPPSRFDNAPGFDPEQGYMRYNWELEQEMTDDFVKQVRDGQVQAAEDLGVQAFVWVAIIDKKTCEVCCLPRAGKTTDEIQAMLDSGELDKEECDAVTPPAHFNCRCNIAPIGSTDEVEGPDWKSFNDWLES